MEEICSAVNELAENFGNEYKIVFSVHKNPVVRETVNRILKDNKNILLIEPMDYLSFIKLLSKATLILTDSGGIQEEAPTLKKPVLLMRDTTERPEAVESGVVRLVGTDRRKIVEEATKLLLNKEEYEKMISNKNPFGDGYAGTRIAKIVYDYLMFGGKDGIS
jgi:UDP-N-acetylglucosamine 2-epimerase (non-hydrolysing)